MSHHLKLCRNISYPYQHCGVCVCQQNQIAAPDPIENHGRRYRQDREPSEDKRAPAALDFYGWSLEVSTYEGKTGRQDREVCPALGHHIVLHNHIQLLHINSREVGLFCYLQNQYHDYLLGRIQASLLRVSLREKQGLPRQMLIS